MAGDDDNAALNTNRGNDSHVARVALKLPPFWKNNIKLWFIQAESNFELSGITNENTKYNNIVAAVDPETLTNVSDILLNPPANDRYNILKERLIQEFSDSKNRQIRKLLSELQLGDDKPSHLLRKMRELAGQSLNDDFLKNLWLQRLPSEIQTILSVSSENLESLAKLADKIFEVRSDPLVSGVYAASASANHGHPVVTSRDSSNSISDDINDLRSQIASLSKQIERLGRNPRRDNFQRGNGRPFNRPYSSRSRSNSRSNSNGLCYYHNKFGAEARNCRTPCSFNENSVPGN